MTVDPESKDLLAQRREGQKTRFRTLRLGDSARDIPIRFAVLPPQDLRGWVTVCFCSDRLFAVAHFAAGESYTLHARHRKQIPIERRISL
jgi:hypothetical protein